MCTPCGNSPVIIRDEVQAVAKILLHIHMLHILKHLNYLSVILFFLMNYKHYQHT